MSELQYGYHNYQRQLDQDPTQQIITSNRIKEQHVASDINCKCKMIESNRQKEKCKFDNQKDYKITLSMASTVFIYETQEDSAILNNTNYQIISKFQAYNLKKGENGRQNIKVLKKERDNLHDKKFNSFQINKQHRLYINYQELIKKSNIYDSFNFQSVTLDIYESLNKIFQGEESRFYLMKNYDNQFIEDNIIYQSLDFIQKANGNEITMKLEQSDSVDKSYDSLVKNDQYNITLINIQKNPLQFLKERNNTLQCINFYYEKCYKQQIQKQNNLNSFNIQIDDEFFALKIALQFFLKEKITKFNPKVILLSFNLGNCIVKDPLIFSKLVKYLAKISQNKLIILPYRDQDLLKDSELNQNYQRCVNCTLQWNEKSKAISQENTIFYYEKLHPQFCENAAQKQMYQSQLRTLRMLKNVQHNMNEKDPIINKCFPLLTKRGPPSILQIEYNSNSQFFIVYNKIEIEEYDGILFLLNELTLRIIKFKESDSAFQIREDQQIQLSFKFGGYHYDEKLQKLIFFYGENKENWSSNIYCLSLNSMSWQTIIWNLNEQQKLNSYQQQQKCYIVNQEQIERIIYNRHQFSISENNINGYQSQNTYLLQGGIYYDQQYNYGCIIQEITINFVTNTYITKILEKNQINKHYKESPSPLIIKMNDYFILYFERSGNFHNPNLSPQIQKITLSEYNKCLIQVETVNIKKDKHYELWKEKYNLFRSDQADIKIIDNNQPVETLFNFKIILIENNKFNKNPLEGKTYEVSFYCFSMQYQTSNNELRMDVKTYKIETIPPMKTLQSEMENNNKEGLYQNAVDNVPNTYLFHYNQQLEEHLLVYKGFDNKICFKRFIFDQPQDEQNQQITYLDYKDLIFQEWQQGTVIIIRKIYHNEGCTLCLLESPFINFQEGKDLQEDITLKIEVKKIFEIKGFKTTHELIGMYVNVRNTEDYEILLLTNKYWYRFDRKIGKDGQPDTKYTTFKHSLHLNVSQQSLLWKTQFGYGLFYTNAKFINAQINDVSQNIILLKYMLFDENKELLSENTLKYHCDQLIPIEGSLQAKINNVLTYSQIITIEIVLRHNNQIQKLFCYCAIDEIDKTLVIKRYCNQKSFPSHKGSQIFELFQSNKKNLEYSYFDGDLQVCLE